MIKRVVCAGFIGTLMFLNTASAKTIELSYYMGDRFERDCRVRLQPDLYNGNISPLLISNVLKDRQQPQGVGTLVSLSLDKTQYRNVPVVKIEYSVNPVHRQYSQSIFFDLTSATAKQNFSKIEFHDQTGLKLLRDGRFTVLRCSW